MTKEEIMKSKIWSILGVFIFISIVSSTELVKPEIYGEGFRILTEVATPRYTLEKLQGIFNDECIALSDHFKNDEIDLIVEKYGPRGWILKHDNELAEGEKEIKKYLDELKKDGATLIGKEFECFEVFIDFDRILAVGPSNNPLEDPIYPLRKSIVINIRIPDGSDHALDSSAYSRHTRRTFD